ncbi:MAG: beta-ketoacyl synthase N-terminal-like domain-containing protein, partial [Bdellovibrionia bacterium]
GLVRRCLVGGVEVLSQLTTEGFKSLQLLAENPCKPFDRNRNGINLSEGAAFLCLEASGEKSLADVTGWGYSTDAFHVTSPEPAGRGCFKAMTSALTKAGLDPKDISWVHCHGTGSHANDLAEGPAVRKLFADTPAVSTKSIHGHSLAASGALEAVVCVQALLNGRVPATHGLENPDPAIPLRHVRAAEARPARHIVKNTLGFGGNNAALVFSLPRGQA